MTNELNYFQISHNCGQDIKIILAHTLYEAVGFYLIEEISDIGAEELDRVERLKPNHKIEVSCVGFPIYKTIDEIRKEKDVWVTPRTIISLECC